MKRASRDEYAEAAVARLREAVARSAMPGALGLSVAEWDALARRLDGGRDFDSNRVAIAEDREGAKVYLAAVTDLAIGDEAVRKLLAVRDGFRKP